MFVLVVMPSAELSDKQTLDLATIALTLYINKLNTNTIKDTIC